VFEIVPTRGVHVYAPGANDYRVISFTLDDQAILEARGLQYPASEIYFFEPLNERVPVFQKPFLLLQRMVVSPAQEHRATLAKMESVTISGRLEYQACSDTVCFNPRSVPVSYTVKLRQLDTERATVAN